MPFWPKPAPGPLACNGVSIQGTFPTACSSVHLPQGFAYIECETREALDKTVALNGTTFQGFSLFVAESKPPGPGGAGGRGGRHGGGRGRFSGPPGGRGFGRHGGGYGRGRGHGGAEGEGADGDGDAEMGEAGGDGEQGHGHGHGGRGGRGGGRGYHGGEGGRGRPGLGHPSRPGMRTHLQVSEGERARCKWKKRASVWIAVFGPVGELGHPGLTWPVRVLPADLACAIAAQQ